jgi:DNA-directed RNA polymerase specialized sigma24 family protein
MKQRKVQKIRETDEREVLGGKNYWEDYYAKGRVVENDRANPDNLTESAGFWLTDDITKEVQGRVEKLMKLSKQILTEQQYKVFVLLAVKDPPLKQREVAKLLGLSRGRINQLWEAARKKMAKAYEQRTA